MIQTPDDPAALGEQARRAMLAGHWEQARLALERALTLAPEDASLLARAAVLEELSGASEAAITRARQALAIDPGEPAAAALLTRLLTDRCRPGEALEVADIALERTRGAAAARLQLARAPPCCYSWGALRRR